ncbi:hypothetical protein [Streptomyces sp. bgisy022]|uniref:hypothetical protein n=1 Tax=Streptomyces sp. bgisy022 TaxID=3413769 RepID=UPI003D7064DA
MKVNGAAISKMAQDLAAYEAHPDLGFACCTAHAVADHVPALLAEVQRMRSSRWDATKVTADLESRLHAMHAELTRARARVAELETDLAAKGQDHAAAVAGWERCRTSLREATEEIARLDSDLGGATARVADLEARAVDRAEVLTEVTTWLVKKAREFRAANQTVQGDTASILASKIERGAIRANNTRMLPADFYEPGHTYTNPEHDTDWKFRVDTVTTHPDNGERTALGWRHSRGEWEPYAYGEDDYDVHRHVGLDDRTEEPS